MQKIVNELFNVNVYPSKRWVEIEKTIKKIGENDDFIPDLEDVDFLYSLKLVLIPRDLLSSDNRCTLTDTGLLYFEEIFIKNNLENGKKILYCKLLEHPPVMAIQQYLFGVKDVSISQVITVLKSVSLWEEDVKLAHFLDLLNSLKIITYNRKDRTIKVLVAPDTEKIPSSVYIDPQRPYSNILWIKKIISDCNGYVYWLDKHFQKEAFEWIFSSADANNISVIKILSLDLDEKNKNAKKEFRRLKSELKNKGIEIEWNVIDSKLMRDSHDRWIISKSGARNIPNVNAISSGQKSELNISDHRDVLEKEFNEYWSKSKSII